MAPIRILLADDHPLFLETAAHYLGLHEDITVVGTAEGGRQALELAQRLAPQIVLIDLAMPDMSGLEVIPQLAAAQPELGIIILTLLDTAQYRKAGKAAGADDFVAKARMTVDLLPAIRRVAESRGSRVPAAGCEQRNAPACAGPAVNGGLN